MNYDDKIKEFESMTDEEVVSTIITGRRVTLRKVNYVSGVEVLQYLREEIGIGDTGDDGQLRCCDNLNEVEKALETEGVSKERMVKNVDAEGHIRIKLTMPNQAYLLDHDMSVIGVSTLEAPDGFWDHAILPYHAKDIAKLIVIADRVTPLASERLAEIKMQRAKRKKVKAIGKSSAQARLPSMLSANGYENFKIEHGYDRAHVWVEVSRSRVVQFFIRYEIFVDSAEKLIAALDTIRDSQKMLDDTLVVEGIPKAGIKWSR